MCAVHHLSLDIETYSDVDIGKAGLYKYAQSPAFQILLLAYSLDGGPVQVLDLTESEGRVPDWLFEALTDSEVCRHAYNAAFEWYCLSRHFHLELPVDHWRCTMLHGLYLGYTAGLDAMGKALGLPVEKQKLATGKALIRYFCTPCAPTKSNGGRSRNLPSHDPAKWALFQEYNAQDVEAIRLVHFLVKESGYTLSGAVEHIRANKKALTRRMEALRILRGVRSELEKLKNSL